MVQIPWFKVDDNLAFHHKSVAAGNSAMGLWVRAGSWCAQNLLDGFVPDHMLTRMGTAAQVEKLISVGLWDRKEGGIVFHQWTERQPLRSEVTAERDAAKERMRSIRAAKKGVKKESSQVSESGSPELPRTAPEVFGNPDPTQPDPTLNSASAADETPAASPPKRSKRKPALPLSDDWRPTEDHLKRCRDLGVDPGIELARFRAHAEANDRRQASWNAAFTQWLLNARPSGNVRPIRPEPDEQGRIQLPPLPRGFFDQ
ncbi:hypothetical protein NOK12_16780 [Nocardioides sp. OK12]|uniref:DnaT-like ssDNA-binding domain-containing protein n=1 Tax=Nocardioides sp. OK12 TaxID=2758661 RepID=UPI0021C3D441|nr:DnaT-like ssDNA-binding domain-containing protein [Nocardioides sp. OK12]GHJ59160.1 hypothetical protein NOK12_16780 [Nocardioides sp. OK12]